MVKASASRAADSVFGFCVRWDFSRSNHTSDVKNDTPVATLPGAWRYMYMVSAGMVGPVSVYCGWSDRKFDMITSISVWPHVQLSEEIRP